MRFHVITIFPEMFYSYLKESIIGRAVKAKKISIKFYNPWDFCPKQERVDARPYGGGPGMVLRPEFIIKAIVKALKNANSSQTLPLRKGRAKGGVMIINFVPSAEKFNTAFAKKFAKKYRDIILIAGRYEGIDARVDKIFKTKKISVGDYVLTGGELPAMILIDCIARQVPGVLGKHESLEEERVSSSEVYTRPEVLKYRGKNYRVPNVLLSGNHAKINAWKQNKQKSG